MHSQANRRHTRPSRAATLPEKLRCTICGCPITRLQANLHQACDAWRCRAARRAQQRAARQQQREQQRRRREHLNQRACEVRDQAAASLSIDQPGSFIPAIVPVNGASLAGLGPQRREAFREHLARLIREAGGQPATASDGPQEVDPVDAADEAGRAILLRSACGVCAGHCCLTGGDHAHLDVVTVRRYMDNHPAEGPSEVLEAFFSRLADRVYQDSCICHTERGCVLPREMRSEICRSFECGRFRDVQAEFSGPGPYRAFVAAMHGDQVVRFRFVSVDR